MLHACVLFGLLSAVTGFNFRTVGFGVWDGVLTASSEGGLKPSTIKLNVTDGATGQLDAVSVSSFVPLAQWKLEYDASDASLFKLYEAEAASIDGPADVTAPVLGPSTLLCAVRWANSTLDTAIVAEARVDATAAYTCYGSVAPVRDPATAKLTLTLADPATGAVARTYVLSRRPLPTTKTWWEENRRNAMMGVLVLGYAYLKNFMRKHRLATAAEAGEGRRGPVGAPGTLAARVAAAAEVEAEAKKVL